MCAGERRALYTRVLTPPDAPQTSVVVGGTLGYADLVHRFAIGPEALLSTVVVNGNASGIGATTPGTPGSNAC